MPALVIAQHDNRRLDPATLATVTAARQLDSNVDVLVAGHGSGAVAEEAARVEGVRRVLLAQAEHLENPVAEDLTELVLQVADGYDAILAPATTFGKNLLPRVAARLDVAQISDIVEVLGPDTFKRYIYAGNVLCTVRTRDARRVLTVRVTAFEKAAAEGGSAAVEEIPAPPPTGLARFVRREVHKGERPELTSARIVVSGGRGVGSKENFRLVEQLADVLGAAIGASRAAVDAGFAPNDWQVGQTGKIVAPELYIAIGISGAIQHLAGMKDSKIIVAINKDPEAPIFEVADYGLVADLFRAVPELIEEIERLRRQRSAA